MGDGFYRQQGFLRISRRFRAFKSYKNEENCNFSFFLTASYSWSNSDDNVNMIRPNDVRVVDEFLAKSETETMINIIKFLMKNFRDKKEELELE